MRTSILGLVAGGVCACAAAACGGNLDEGAGGASAAVGVATSASVGSGGAGGTSSGSGGFGNWKFEWKKHSFSFDNYGSEKPVTNLTPAEMLRMFGPGVCAAPPQGASCELTPSAAKWMESNNKGMGNGHCEGMATLSLMFAVGKANPQDFGAASAYELQLDGNEKLQREIAYWWATQSVDSVAQAVLRSAPSGIVKALQDSFKGGGEAYTFGLYKRTEPRDGHANTPYAVIDAGAGKFAVKVYENNYPNDDKQFDLDAMMELWQYQATPNPNVPAALYDGDHGTNQLELTPLSSRLGQLKCPTCGELQMDGKSVKGNLVDYREVTLSGQGDLLLLDDKGNKLGFESGNFVNQIPGAKTLDITHELAFWDERNDPLYRVPLFVPLTITLDGSSLKADSLSSVFTTAPGCTFAVEDVALSAGQVDTIKLSGGCDTIEYGTTSADTPLLELGVSLPGADYLFAIAVTGEMNGVDATLVNDVPSGKLRLTVGAQDGQAVYGVTVLRLADTGTDEFTHIGSTIASTAKVFLDYASWKGNGQPMTFETDANGDGTIDSTLPVADSK